MIWFVLKGRWRASVKHWINRMLHCISRVNDPNPGISFQHIKLHQPESLYNNCLYCYVKLYYIQCIYIYNAVLEIKYILNIFKRVNSSQVLLIKHFFNGSLARVGTIFMRCTISATGL